MKLNSRGGSVIHGVRDIFNDFFEGGDVVGTASWKSNMDVMEHENSLEIHVG